MLLVHCSQITASSSSLAGRRCNCACSCMHARCPCTGTHAHAHAHTLPPLPSSPSQQQQLQWWQQRRRWRHQYWWRHRHRRRRRQRRKSNDTGITPQMRIMQQMRLQERQQSVRASTVACRQVQALTMICSSYYWADTTPCSSLAVMAASDFWRRK